MPTCSSRCATLTGAGTTRVCARRYSCVQWVARGSPGSQMELDTYLAYHQRRFDYICGLAQRLKPSRASVVLDVGPGPMTKQLNAYYDVVWSLGFEHTAVYSAAEDGRRHITFDLNRANDPAAWVPMPKFDLIVFSE